MIKRSKTKADKTTAIDYFRKITPVNQEMYFYNIISDLMVTIELGLENYGP
jgi:hypothetical protein